MPQYANPDNPNAGELIQTKVDPVSGAVIEVAPHTKPSFHPIKDEREKDDAPKPPKEQSEADRERVAKRNEAEEDRIADDKEAHDRNEHLVAPENDPKGTKTVAKSATKPPKAPAKVVKPVEKAGEKTESPAPPVTRGVVTTHSPDATHVDVKSKVFEDKK